tara:strand:- start:85 stop:336 length:252 start_codon:yes stop_codon:yes gene_type:complete
LYSDNPQDNKNSHREGAILMENTKPFFLVRDFGLYPAFAIKSDPDATILFAPLDHIITETSAFHVAICEGLKKKANRLISWRR